MTSMDFNCLLIPGGGLTESGSLPDWTTARLEKALEYQHLTEWIIPLSAGTVHKPPPIDHRGFPIFESQKAAEYLAAAGINPERILTEICSYDTIGNAYFSRILFTDPMSLPRIHVITSDFHLPRTKAIFDWVFSLKPLQHNYILSFESVPAAGLSPAALKARQEREETSLNKLEPNIQRMRSIADFQRWLYSEHTAYAVTNRDESLSPDELKSY